MKLAIHEVIDACFKAKYDFKLGDKFIRAGEPVLILDISKTDTQEINSQVSDVTGDHEN